MRDQCRIGAKELRRNCCAITSQSVLNRFEIAAQSPVQCCELLSKRNRAAMQSVCTSCESCDGTWRVLPRQLKLQELRADSLLPVATLHYSGLLLTPQCSSVWLIAAVVQYEDCSKQTARALSPQSEKSVERRPRTRCPLCRDRVSYRITALGETISAVGRRISMKRPVSSTFLSVKAKISR
jgi:hypothetical protein